MKFFLACALTAVLLLQVAGCGASKDAGAASEGTAGKSSANEAVPVDAPVQAYKGAWSGLKRTAGPYSERLLTPRGLSPKRVVTRDLKEGSGATIQRGDTFLAHYVSYDYGTGKVIEPYWRTPPGRLPWGTGALVDGWEPGLKGMRAGGIRELIVPSSMAYENGPRVYLVKLVGIEPEEERKPKKTRKPAAASARSDWTPLKRLAGNSASRLILPDGPPPKKVVRRDLRSGKGPMIESEDWASFRYVQFDYKTGKVGEDEWKGAPFHFIYGTDGLVDALETGLRGMRVGGMREILAPSATVYDNPPRVYLVELLGLQQE
jgi:FKBP-type peptidyl-prolyl cis-trans isomerase